MAEPVPEIVGVQTLRWGAAGVLPLAGIEPGSIDMDGDQLIDEKAHDANGYVIARILGDEHEMIRANCLYVGATKPAVGTFVTITYDDGGSTQTNSNYFYNGKFRRRYTNRGNLMLELELEFHSQIVA
jgi:hypothetical protein